MKALLITLFSFFTLSGLSQQLIPRVGLSIATTKIGEGIVAPGYSTDFRTGIIAGAEVQFAFNDKSGLAVNLLFNQKGWNGEWEWNANKYEEKTKLNYLDIAITPFVKVSPVYFMAGLCAGYGLNGKFTQTQFLSGRPYIVKHNVTFNQSKSSGPDLYIDNRIDLAGLVVAGILIKNKAFIDIRYQRSLTDIFTEATS